MKRYTKYTKENTKKQTKQTKKQVKQEKSKGNKHIIKKEKNVTVKWFSIVRDH